MRGLLHRVRIGLQTPSRTPRMAVVVGRLLGAAFVICFATGLYSHFLQEPLPWMRFPTSPAWLYQLTQGIHITAGIACFPLILGKLYAIYPQLFQTPLVRGPLHLLERASIALFVGASLVEITIGLINTFQWYPWPFGFRETHFALAFVVIGSLAVHIGVKLPIIAKHWTKRSSDRQAPADDAEPPEETPVRGLTGRVFRWIDETPTRPAEVSRRGFLTAIGASALGVVVLTAGQSFRLLDPVNLFAPRKQGYGPQSLPVNRTAEQAAVTESAMDPSWALVVMAGGVAHAFTRAQLLALPQTTADLPIACVEGWSQTATWTGVPVRRLLDEIGAPSDAALTITSLEQDGAYRQTRMGGEYSDDPTTLVALRLDGEDLDIQHGYPARIIAPGRPGVLQTKWLSRIEVD
jgi:hypothetical protein